MKVTLEKTFPIPASADVAWTLLQDIPSVASCMPGANITEQLDATHYKGTVAVKVGPASLAFRGEIEVLSVDAATRTLRLVGKGTDTTGGSGASMDLTARLDTADAASCNLVGNSEVSMSGKAAAFGGRMMGSVSDQILKQFAANFASTAQVLQAKAPPPGGAAATTAPAAATSADAVATGHAAIPEMPHATSGGSDTDPTSSMTITPSAAPPSPPRFEPLARPVPVQATNELNAFALIWAVFKEWVRSLFGAKRA